MFKLPVRKVFTGLSQGTAGVLKIPEHIKRKEF
jgi:hypothetical protein